MALVALVVKNSNQLRGNVRDVVEHDVTRKESIGSHWFDGIGGVSAVASAGSQAQCNVMLGSARVSVCE